MSSEEEAKEEEKEVREVKSDVVGEEMFFTIPLRKVWIHPRPLRTSRALKVVRAFIKKHLKVRDVKIDNKLNQFIWKKGIEKSPPRVRVRVVKDKEGFATADLFEEKR